MQTHTLIVDTEPYGDCKINYLWMLQGAGVSWGKIRLKKLMYLGPKLLNYIYWQNIFPSGLDGVLQDHLMVLGVLEVCLCL